MKKNSTIRQCEIVSLLNDAEGNIIFNMDTLPNILHAKQCIDKYSYIIHDKDVYTDDDEKKNPEHKADALKPSHIHLLLKFNSPQHFRNIGQWFGLQEQFVSRIKSSWSNAVAYQLHRNAKDKYQYSIDEIKANFNVQSIIDKIDKYDYLQKVLNDILDGKIREYNKTREIDGLTLVQNARQIREAFKVRAEHLQATIKDRNTECIFITGKSGAGKTTLAKKIAKENGLDYFLSSGSNDILDGYSQEPCVILDELRPSSLGLADLLKLLDNHTASSVKSRYKNKFLQCELIIITSVLDIDTFYKNVFMENDEPITQLKRRCGTYIKMFPDIMYVYTWDSKRMAYTGPVPYINNITDEFAHLEELTAEDITKKVRNLMPFLKSIEDYDKECIEEAMKAAAENPNEILENSTYGQVISDEECFKLLKNEK